MVRSWLERGVDGFRLDVFNVVLQAPRPARQPGRRPGRPPWTRQDHLHDRDQPDFVELLGALPGASSTT